MLATETPRNVAPFAHVPSWSTLFAMVPAVFHTDGFLAGFGFGFVFSLVPLNALHLLVFGHLGQQFWPITVTVGSKGIALTGMDLFWIEVRLRAAWRTRDERDRLSNVLT